MLKFFKLAYLISSSRQSGLKTKRFTVPVKLTRFLGSSRVIFKDFRLSISRFTRISKIELRGRFLQSWVQ